MDTGLTGHQGGRVRLENVLSFCTNLFYFIDSRAASKMHEDDDDEHIYASLPEEEEEDSEATEKARESGSFSARSTLPDNCQLTNYRGENDQQNTVMSTFFNSKNSKTNGETHQQLNLFNKPNQHSSSSNGSPQSSGTSTVDEDDDQEEEEDIYEEVAQLLVNKKSPESNTEQQMRRSASQDTLRADGENGDDDGDGDDDDGESIEEDLVSMLSEASSSSTFSSFTTCANQDFEFIVSSTGDEQQSPSSEVQSPSTSTSSAKVHHANSLKEGELHESNLDVAVSQQQILPPNTLSMAAIYYNRFILNEASSSSSSFSNGKSGKGGGKGKGGGSGHRQRPKVNRRQSFSTAYELRQRILINQMAAARDKSSAAEPLMELDEEEAEETEQQQQQTNHYLDQTNPFEDDHALLSSYRLSRRISTSEDNLLSIISTMANCGDQEGDADKLTPSPCKSSSDSVSSSPSKSSANSTFVKKEPSRSNGSGGGLYNKRQPRNVSRVPSSPSTSSSGSANSNSSAIPRAASSNLHHPPTTTHSTNISIKELKVIKSKKKKLAQAANSKPSASNGSSENGAHLLRPKSGGDKIVELGSLWNRSSVATAGKPKSTPPAKGQPRFTATGKLLASINNTATITTGSSSSPSTPCRVPTFIPAPRRDSPARRDHQGGSTFASKLAAPSTYGIAPGGLNRAVKQNARQNAILAKNALSGGSEHEPL